MTLSGRAWNGGALLAKLRRVNVHGYNSPRRFGHQRSHGGDEVMAECDAGNRSTRLGTLLNDLGSEGLGVGTAC